MTSILGISAFFHDSAAAIIQDGEIIAAAQEERFTRKKHDPGFPSEAINYVLKESKLELNQVDHIVFFEKPFLKFERLLETYVAMAPFGFKQFSLSMPIWLREKLFQKKFIFDKLVELDEAFKDIDKLKFSEHHLSHAASAFYPSPFEEAIVLTLDGVGEWATTTVAVGKGNNLQILKEIHFPHSLGLLYSAFTYYTGFKVNSGEYKVMGLAPYGKPRFKDIIIKELMDLKDDGSFKLNMKYFNYATGLTMTNKKFSDLFGQPVRDPKKDLLTDFHMDIASSVQAVTEEIVLRLTRNIADEYKIKNLCLAGGVALNCVANGKILKEKYFDHIWIQPAAGDAGGSLGAALDYWYRELKKPRENFKDKMKGAYLGPRYDDNFIEKKLKALRAEYKKISSIEISSLVAKELANSKTVGWFQGRMEFGPRALGSRSILFHTKDKSVNDWLNKRLKRTEFMPFAPVTTEKLANKCFENWTASDSCSPFMTQTFNCKKDFIKENPAVVHIDGTARPQIIKKNFNKIYYQVVDYYCKKSGNKSLINTSFNQHEEPIVCSPADAIKSLLMNNVDYLAIGNYLVKKK